jgi:hypothetical protein
VPAGCPSTTGIVTTELFLIGTKIGQEPAPAETTWPITPGATSAPATQRTTTPLAPIYEVTFVGALGNEYVFACADGTSNETSKDVARAREPRLKILRDERVLFIPHLIRVRFHLTEF